MSESETVRARRHAIAAGHHLAAEAGFAVLEDGGNAVDAAVAAGLTLGVVQPDIVNVAGVAPIMIWLEDRRALLTIDGLGVWPAATDIEVFEREHNGHVPTGPLRTVVPAAPDAWLTALEHFGRMSFADVASPARAFARDGFPVHPLLVSTIEAHLDDYARWPDNARVFLRDGEAPEVGSTFLQPDLAATLGYLIDEARAARGGRENGIGAVRRAFYEGDVARAIAGHQEAEHGWLSRQDLAGFRVRREAPLRRPWHDLELATCGAWCQGPALQMALGLLDPDQLAGLDRDGDAHVHRLIQALDLAFADREAWFGDPRFVDVPLDGLLDPAYLARRRDLMSERAFEGMPPAGRPGARAPGPVAASAEPNRTRDTSYLAVVDRHGNAVSATPSDVSYESPMVPGTGLVPSSRGSQSWGRRGHPSAAAPGKRPRLTPNPAMALRGGRPALVFGTPGGDVQTQAVLQVLLNVELFGDDLQAAIDRPRFATFNFPSSFEPHGMTPNRVRIEAALDARVGDALRARGHAVEAWPDRAWQAGAVCAVRIDRARGVIEAAADGRRHALALGR